MKPTHRRNWLSSPSRTLPVVVFALACVCGVQSMAHPGHGLTERGFSHILTNPDHLAVVATLAAGMVIGSQFVRKKRWRMAMQLIGTLLILASMGIWQLSS